MNKRIAASLLLVLALVACRASKQDPAPVVDAGTASAATASAAAADSAAAPVAVAAHPDEHEQVVDAGPDAAVRKRRRLAANLDAGGSAVAEPTPTPEPVAVASPPPETAPASAKRASATGPMADDVPYGGSGKSGAPVLKKTPLPSDDPWAKTDAAK